MIVHRYKALGNSKGPKDRLYFPKRGVLACSIGPGAIMDLSNKAASFYDSSDDIRHAEDTIKGYCKGIFEYFGKIKLPKTEVDKLIASHKRKENAERNFQNKVVSLTSLVN